MENASARRAMAALALLFLAKAVLLALFVTPLWEVPDESGHYAYVQDLADGKGLPIYGKSPLPEAVISHWKAGPQTGNPPPPFNWVAQHPPLYHFLAVPFLAGARLLTEGIEWHLRAPRLFSAIAGAAALLLFFRVLREATEDAAFALVAAGAVSFLPMYTHLASGTHHEVLMALAGGAAALFFVRLVKSGEFSEGIKMAGALAAAGGIKLTAVPLSLALVALAGKHLSAKSGKKLAQWLAIALAAFTIPALWALRNWMTIGHPLAHPSGRSFRLSELLTHLQEQPVLDHTFKNFLGLIGWMGTGEPRWFQISGAFLALYLLLGLIVALSAAVWLWKNARSALRRIPPLAVFCFCLLALSAGGSGPVSPLKRLLYSLLAALPFFCIARIGRRSSFRDEIVTSSQFVFLVFGLAYFFNVWRGYAIYGEMRAVHGRYFFAILPFLILSMAYPAVLLWQNRKRRDLAMILVLAAFFANEAAFFLMRVLPFYAEGRLR